MNSIQSIGTVQRCTTAKEHNDVSRRLAYAIGWPESLTFANQVHVREDQSRNYNMFDYRDPSVVWPVAEWFIFPMKCDGNWRCWLNATESIVADTAALAVALAVITVDERTSVTRTNPPAVVPELIANPS